MEIFNVGNNGVNLYLLKSATHNLLLDSGFPGTLHDLGRALRKTNTKISEIDFLVVTHFHPDHAGLVQELKNKSVTFVILDFQVPFIAKMEHQKKRLLESRNYKPLIQTDNRCITLPQSRRFLEELGIHGEIISTKSHSEDGLALVLDSGEAFIGDLLLENMALELKDPKSLQDWEKLKSLGAKSIFPSHSN
ncbi:MBL fold metallo-hydrolase [Algoriphagus aestuariicola]|uniref:MBL fold metallo-hydrolase n=1 Tax=Algoriphagus aestuariicola TaxID=1852016 RepID=A0ABS3BLB3_9BACT|nr:MBL fold metallo-hydrolase [Algoriphagus aestuariicola]MBN7800097.1 MBL fold metallo-hydrolase [Algoriphagus aestuariicola]